MERNIPFRFDVSFDEGGLRPTNDPQLYTGKVRVFYKYSNRNGSYITDSYADRLAQSAYMKPVFGYYDIPMQDFLGHEGPEKAKAYGFVLPNSLEWVDHLDDDGITRTYATYEVLVWAKYWREAMTIVQKTQSMEIDPETVRGEWRRIGDNTIEEYVYTDGVMAGLCILGDMKTPCFEGAAFFSVDDDSYVEFTQAIKNYFSYGGKDAMNVKVAGLEHANFEAIWNALNPNFNEEGAYSIDFVPCEITDEHIFALACTGAGKVNKYSYSFEEEQLKVELVEEIDYKAVAAQFEAQNGEINVKLTDATNLFEELQGKYDTLVSERTALQEQFEKLQGEFETLKAEFEQKQQEFNDQAAVLVQKDATISQQSEVISDYENKEKEAIINKFATTMPAEILQTIIDKKDSLTIKELNTELALEYTKFSMAKEQKEDIHIPQEPKQEPALFKILNAYKK